IDGKVGTRPARPCSNIETGCLLYSAPREVKEYIATHSSEIWGVSETTAIDKMMAVGIKADPAGIGPPISILKIAPNDVRWLRPSGCPSIKKEAPQKQKSKPNSHKKP